MEAMILTDIETIPAGLRVGAMTLDVLSSVVTLEERCGLNSRGVEGYRKMLSNSNAILLVVNADDESHCVVGAFSGNVVIDELQIDNIVVSESWRRKGVGGMLLRAALLIAGGLGAHTATLEVRSANLPARTFYEKEGFMIVGFRKQYYTAPSDDALLLSREIQSKS